MSAGALQAIDRILDRGGEADDVLRAGAWYSTADARIANSPRISRWPRWRWYSVRARSKYGM